MTTLANDPLVALLHEAGMPVTRENWIDIAWGTTPPDPWMPENEDDLPEELQQGYPGAADAAWKEDDHARGQPGNAGQFAPEGEPGGSGTNKGAEPATKQAPKPTEQPRSAPAKEALPALRHKKTGKVVVGNRGEAYPKIAARRGIESLDAYDRGNYSPDTKKFIPLRTAEARDAWNEKDHPRGQPENAGEFGPGGGGSNKPAEPAAPTGEKSEGIEVASEGYRYAKPEYVDKVAAAARSAASELNFPPSYIHIQAGFSSDDERRAGESMIKEKRINMYPDAGANLPGGGENVPWIGFVRHEICHQKFSQAMKHSADGAGGEIETNETDKAIHAVFSDQAHTMKVLDNLKGDISKYADYHIANAQEYFPDSSPNSRTMLLRIAISESLAEVANYKAVALDKKFRAKSPEFTAMYEAVMRETVH